MPRLPYAMRDANQLKKIAPARNWVVEGLLTEGAVAVIAGHPKHGKGYFAKQLAASVATGKDFLGEFKVPRPGKTIYLDVNQHDPGEFRREVLIALEGKARFIPSIVVPSDRKAEREGRFQIHFRRFPGDEAEDDLREKINSFKPRLVVIDDFETMRDDPPSIGSAYRYDKRIMASIRKVAQESGVAFLIVLHLRKSDRESTAPTFQDLSGTAAIRGEADVNMILFDGGKAAKPKPGLLRVEGRGIAPFTRRMQRFPQRHKRDGFWYVDQPQGSAGATPIDGSPAWKAKYNNRDRLIRESLTNGPKTTAEVRDFLAQHGLLFADDNYVRVLLNRKKGNLCESAGTGIWRLA